MECLGLSHAAKHANLTGRGYRTSVEKKGAGAVGVRGDVGSVLRRLSSLARLGFIVNELSAKLEALLRHYGAAFDGASETGPLGTQFAPIFGC
jgi:hypothetical protein